MKVMELLTDESKWTKRSSAKVSTGKPCSSHHKDAVCFCLVGAVVRCYGPNAYKVYDLLYNDLKQSLVDWNDAPERTFEEVKALVERLDI